MLEQRADTARLENDLFVFFRRGLTDVMTAWPVSIRTHDNLYVEASNSTKPRPCGNSNYQISSSGTLTQSRQSTRTCKKFISSILRERIESQLESLVETSIRNVGQSWVIHVHGSFAG